MRGRIAKGEHKESCVAVCEWGDFRGSAALGPHRGWAGLSLGLWSISGDIVACQWCLRTRLIRCRNVAGSLGKGRNPGARVALGTCWKGVRKEGRGGGNRGGENVISVKAKFAEEKVVGCGKFLFWKTFRVCGIFTLLIYSVMCKISENFPILFWGAAFLGIIFSIALSS